MAARALPSCLAPISRIKLRPLLTGKRFRLERATLAVDGSDGKRRAVTVPIGEIIKVVSGPTDGNGMVDILWEGRIVEIFAIEVDIRGTEITDPSARAYRIL